jgi:hypothetical protein
MRIYFLNISPTFYKLGSRGNPIDVANVCLNVQSPTLVHHVVIRCFLDTIKRPRSIGTEVISTDTGFANGLNAKMQRRDGAKEAAVPLCGFAALRGNDDRRDLWGPREIMGRGRLGVQTMRMGYYHRPIFIIRSLCGFFQKPV